MKLLLSTFLLAGGLAQAQELIQHEDVLVPGTTGWLLSAEDDTFYQSGIGAPTVTYDESNSQWVMYFETKFAPYNLTGSGEEKLVAAVPQLELAWGEGNAPEASRCMIPGVGFWGLGRATSPDGLNWTLDEEPVLLPQADTFYECVIAQPTVIKDDEGFHIWFKAHQRRNACPSGSGTGTPVQPAWGCEEITGVGYAFSEDGINFEVPNELPEVPLSDFGFPAITIVDDVYYMLTAHRSGGTGNYDLWQSTSQDGGDTWSTVSQLISAGTQTWAADELYNPALTCESTGGNPLEFPFALFTGGRQKTGNTTDSAGLGRLYSQDWSNWLWDSQFNPYIEWTDLTNPEVPVTDKDWRHWDVVAIGDEYAVYYAQKDDSNRNRIGLAYTYTTQQSSLPVLDVSNRRCTTTAPVDTADSAVVDTATTDVPEPTDTETDPGNDTAPEPTDTETDDTDGDTNKGGCSNCSTGTTPAGSALLLGLPFLLALRRREQ